MSAPFSTASGADVRVRFCPSPTGTPHVGLIRTALFNWAYARHHGGKLVFRIEDTDASRDSEESYLQLLDAMRWLGIDWDEGIEVGGPYGPYRQSERRALYDDVLRRLIDAGYVYEAFSTPEEVEARHRAAGRDPKLGYDNLDRGLSAAQIAAYRGEGRVPPHRSRRCRHEVERVRARARPPAARPSRPATRPAHPRAGEVSPASAATVSSPARSGSSEASEEASGLSPAGSVAASSAWPPSSTAGRISKAGAGLSSASASWPCRPT